MSQTSEKSFWTAIDKNEGRRANTFSDPIVPFNTKQHRMHHIEHDAPILFSQI